MVEPRTPVEGTVLGGRAQLQWNTTSADAEPSSEFFLRRARIWAAARVNDWIDAAVQVDIAKGAVAGRYVFIRFELTPSTRVSFGQMKRAFDVFELTSSSQILVVERDGDIRGVEDPCSGVGGLCSYSRFSEQLELSSLDVGMLLQGELADDRLAYMFTLTNGPGANTREENDTKSASGRIVWSPLEKLHIGANGAVHDYVNEVTGENDLAPATAFDVEWGDFEGGLHVQAGVMSGHNWLNLDLDGEPSRFFTYQGIATYRFPLSSPGRVSAIEPVGRVSWGDPDRGTGLDAGWLLSPGVMLHFVGRNKMAAGLDVWRPQSGETAWGLKLQTYVYF